MIKAVIFDWGGVCCQEGELFSLKPLQKALKMNPDEITAQTGELYFDYYRGKYTSDEFWKAFLIHFNLQETEEINPAELSKAYLNSYVLWQDVLDMALSLQERYQVGVLSNLTPGMRDYIREKNNTAKYFQYEVYSCDEDVQCLKPDKKPYEVMLKKLNQHPENCLFIDNSEKNIQGAKTLGFKTLLFESKPQFFKAIKINLEQIKRNKKLQEY